MRNAYEETTIRRLDVGHYFIIVVNLIFVGAWVYFRVRYNEAREVDYIAYLKTALLGFEMLLFILFLCVFIYSAVCFFWFTRTFSVFFNESTGIIESRIIVWHILAGDDEEINHSIIKLDLEGKVKTARTLIAIMFFTDFLLLIYGFINFNS